MHTRHTVMPDDGEKYKYDSNDRQDVMSCKRIESHAKQATDECIICDAMHRRT